MLRVSALQAVTLRRVAVLPAGDLVASLAALCSLLRRRASGATSLTIDSSWRVSLKVDAAAEPAGSTAGDPCAPPQAGGSGLDGLLSMYQAELSGFAAVSAAGAQATRKWLERLEWKATLLALRAVYEELGQGGLKSVELECRWMEAAKTLPW